MKLAVLMDNLRAALTMQQVADMGVVHRGRMGHADCSVARWRGQAELTLSSARPSGVPVVAQFPLEACVNIRAALVACAAAATPADQLGTA